MRSKQQRGGDWNEKPLMRIDGDGVGVLDAGEACTHRLQQHSGAAIAGVDV